MPTERPKTLVVSGFPRGHYPEAYKSHWTDISRNIHANLLDNCEPKYPVMRKYYSIEFPSHDQAKKVLDVFKDSPIPQWTDPRGGKPNDLRIKFDRPIEDRLAGRFRSHFYNIIGKHIKEDPKYTDKNVKMRIISQILIADIDGEPYELVSMPKNRIGKGCKIEPIYEAFEHIGITKDTADELIAMANNKASAEGQ